MKVTAIAPSNIAFIKYWGKTDEILRLPQNSSISMDLDGLSTMATVEFSNEFTSDEICLNGKILGAEPGRISRHIDRVRKLAGITAKAKIASKNNFPASSGLASSASGFAALTVAAAAAAGLKLSEKELSIIARQGSGSACRSIPDGFVEWHKGDSSETSYATSLYPANHWDIADVIAIVSEEEKNVSSTAGQKSAAANKFFAARLANIEDKIKNLKNCFANKDFSRFGTLIEAEALELQSIIITSTPALIYWQPKTLELIKKIADWRQEGLEIYFTEDAGPNLHIIVEGKNIDALLGKLKGFEGIKRTVVCKPGRGTALSDRHLF